MTPEEQQQQQTQQTQQQQMSERVERDVRFLIGDLQMQIILLRNLLDIAQRGQQSQQPIKPNARPTVVS